MEQKILLKVLILLLGFFYALSLVTATPLSRSLKLDDEAYSSTNQESVMQQGFMEETGNYEQVILKGEEEGFLIHGRMVAESADYPGAVANKNHDPKPPRT
ncbi:uncharacterized protein LOC113285571 isoform X1 [Papaver somniferum]|uniref:uncharacterized protein LOC113285571 isoform X1 n=1 Tax=Papaver somniferum TaxID=3469 RepID=UPI000E6F6E39|nr:uncharacterized protein LOC113285571 isoform X1 [Papaver somniferum]